MARDPQAASRPRLPGQHLDRTIERLVGWKSLPVSSGTKMTEEGCEVEVTGDRAADLDEHADVLVTLTAGVG